MMRKKIYLLLSILLMASQISYAQDNSEITNIIKNNEPIEIISDRMEAFNEEKMVVFSGNASAKKGDVVLKADQLFIYYKNETGKIDKTGIKVIEGGGELDRIEAKGNVIVTQGKNLITGCKVVIYINEDRGSVVPCTTGNNERVKAIIYPQEKKEGEK